MDLSDYWCTSIDLELYTDASGVLGYGVVFGKHWCYGEWPDSWRRRNITLLEFYPIVLSPYLWGNHMPNQRILFFTDNDALALCY